MAARRSTGLAALGFGMMMVVGSATGQGVPAESTKDQPAQLVDVRRVSQLIGSEVIGEEGEGKVGEIDDLVMDDRGRIHYLLINREEESGAGADRLIVPGGAATFTRFEEDRWQVRIALSEDRLASAPTLEGESILGLDDPGRREQIAGWYANPERDLVEKTADDSGQSALFRIGELMGARILGGGPEGREELGVLEDLLLNDEGRACYAVLRRREAQGGGEHLIPIPVTELRIGSGPEKRLPSVIVAASGSEMEDAPKLEGEWNRMINGSFVAGVCNYFAKLGPR